MYKVFGYLNILLVVLITAPYWTRKLNQWFFHSKSKAYQKLQRTLRSIHKPAAAVLLISIIVHGYLALRSFRLHTGTIVGIAFILTALFGLIFYLTKKLPFLKVHRALALVAVLLVVVHLLFPSLLYTLGIS